MPKRNAVTLEEITQQEQALLEQVEAIKKQLSATRTKKRIAAERILAKHHRVLGKTVCEVGLGDLEESLLAGALLAIQADRDKSECLERWRRLACILVG